jgi:hypothetical protein
MVAPRRAFQHGLRPDPVVHVECRACHSNKAVPAYKTPWHQAFFCPHCHHVWHINSTASDSTSSESLIERISAGVIAPIAPQARAPIARQGQERRSQERRGLGVIARRKEEADQSRRLRQFLLVYFGQLPRMDLLLWIGRLWLWNASHEQLTMLVEAVVVERSKRTAARPKQIGQCRQKPVTGTRSSETDITVAPTSPTHLPTSTAKGTFAPSARNSTGAAADRSSRPRRATSGRKSQR